MAETVAAPAVDASEAAAPDVTPAAAAPVDPLAPKPGEKTYRVKINGKEEVWSERKVLERAQKADGAEAAMKEAAQYRTAFNRFVSEVQDPSKLLSLLNDPAALKYDEAKQVALIEAMLSSKKPTVVNAIKQWLYKNEVEPSQLTPEERRARELEDENKKFRADAEDRQKAEEERKFNTERERFLNDYRLKIGQAMKTAALPMTEDTVRLIANGIRHQRRMGQAANIPQAVEWVKQYLHKTASERYEKASDEELLSLFPPGLPERINKILLKRLKEKEAGKEPLGEVRGVAKKGEKKTNLADQLHAISRGKKVF